MFGASHDVTLLRYLYLYLHLNLPRCHSSHVLLQLWPIFFLCDGHGDLNIGWHHFSSTVTRECRLLWRDYHNRCRPPCAINNQHIYSSFESPTTGSSLANLLKSPFIQPNPASVFVWSLLCLSTASATSTSTACWTTSSRAWWELFVAVYCCLLHGESCFPAFWSHCDTFQGSPGWTWRPAGTSKHWQGQGRSRFLLSTENPLEVKLDDHGNEFSIVELPVCICVGLLENLMEVFFWKSETFFGAFFHCHLHFKTCCHFLLKLLHNWR